MRIALLACFLMTPMRIGRYLLCLVCAVSSPMLSRASAQEAYDLLLKGGHVVDPKNEVDAVRDVAIKGGKVVKVARDIPRNRSVKVVPVRGLYVVPGLIDVHVHVYAGTGWRDVYAGDGSVYPDGHTFRSGVTTVVDAGTSGWRNFADFKERVIDRSKTRVLAWVNIVAGGMGDRASQQNGEDMVPEALAKTAKRFPRLIVGVKTAHYDGPEWIAVERAVEAGKLSGLPVMVDFGAFLKERPFQQLVLEKMRPGDVYTHLYYRHVPLLDDNGKLLPYLARARKRGVKFDVGHGRESFLWRQAAPAVRQGFVPDTISTDLHIYSMNAAMKDMTTTLSKFLTLGVPLKDVIRMSTLNAALLIRRAELGNLSVGTPADVAVLRLRQGDFGFLDATNARLRGTQKLECELTLREGEVVWDLNGRAGDEYESCGRTREARGEEDG